MKIKPLVLASLLACAFVAATPARAAVDATPFAYMSLAGGEPWGSSSNVDAMNTAFGAANWSRLNFGDDFTSYAFVYIDGGDQAGAAFAAYVAGHQALLEGYVNDGGRLFLNAATTNLDQGSSYGLVFGASTQQGGIGYSGTGAATDAGHPLFANGAGTSWSGTAFAHNAISHGANFTPLVTGDAGQTIVAGGSFGYGYVMLGGQTSTLWHSGVAGSNPLQLRVNELSFGADVAAVPEPQSYALLLAGLGTLAWLARRRQAAGAK